MAEHVNPLPYLADLQEFYALAAQEGGITIDAELCRAFAEGVADVSEIVSALLTLCEGHGLIDLALSSDVVPALPRTPVERARLAAAAVAADPGARVVRLPAPFRPASANREGSAA